MPIKMFASSILNPLQMKQGTKDKQIIFWAPLHFLMCCGPKNFFFSINIYNTIILEYLLDSNGAKTSEKKTQTVENISCVFKPLNIYFLS